MSALSTTLFELFADNLPERADACFLIDPDRSYNYGEVGREVERAAACLLHHDVKPGDRVIVQLRKSMREVAAMLAIARTRGVIVNVNTAFTLEQLLFVAEDCGASALIVEPPIAVRLHDVAATVLTADLWAGQPANEAPPAAGLDSELAAIIYTSGSTGKPKGVMLSHRNILAGARSVARYLGLRSEDRLLSVLPYSFDYGLNQLMTMMLLGGAVVHQPLAMATEILRTLERHAVTGMAAVPPLWIQLVRLLDETPVMLPSLRLITNSGGKIPLDILQRMPRHFPNTRIFLMYGLTEAFRSTYLDPQRFDAKMGSIGRAIPGAQVYVVKPGEGIAAPGEAGELVHHGPLVSMGYWNRPEATADKIRPCPELAHLIGDEPVVHSGDIVKRDEDGDIWFVGRNDALIKTSGFRVSPDDVEDLVHRSGLAADVVAFGVEDDLLGQCVHVAASLLPGATREALAAHCRKVMPAYMVPRVIHIWPDAMPRTASGKLARTDVVHRCEAQIMDNPPVAEGATQWP
ncbi:AMP-dependent synthetase [Sphingobium sp. 22B]|uniref:AMP-binding protein n=1 Tax=unclassified Sphingobium TaxID=2611147 RepID=UPI000782DFD0|nr:MULTISPECIES: AMP-binding protein [unclassified Sphingobium]KXU32638.1 AMP-dependent synthetase [Sphingobium sp. AM]KYC32715.1 AMP-dependent synthetase [Sphingobium sp. 22B]OAP31605.1 AMP-dependent synthetase [Sphingobium sp. 20006FA]